MSPSRQPRMSQFWLGLAVVVLFAAGTRYRLLDLPLERDEGEYAYAGQLILDGLAPYTHLYNMKLPGIYAAYALIEAAFGESLRAVHWGLLLVNASTIVLLFLAGRRLFDEVTGLAAAAAFAVLSLGLPVLGLAANAEHFVVLPLVAALPFLLSAAEREGKGAPLAAGLLLGIAILMKQHGAAFAAAGGLWLAVATWRRNPGRGGGAVVLRRLLPYACGVVLPYLATCAVFAAASDFGRFWFWTVDYGRAYTTQVPLDRAWGSFTSNAGPLVQEAPLLWVLCGVGLSATLWDPAARRRVGFMSMLTAASLVAISPAFYFRPHYFLLTLPAAALYIGVATSALGRRLSHHALLAVLPLLLALATALWSGRSYLFQLSPTDASRKIYGGNPFPESIEISRLIAEESAPGDTIAVIGSEPQIYFYAGRRAATGYIYTYPLMELHDFAARMQEEMIAEIEQARPRLMVFVGVPTSWLRRPESSTRIIEWYREYSAVHYRRVALVEIFADHTEYLRDREAQRTPRAKAWLEVVKRR